MFYKNSDKNNTTKGIRAIAERTFVMLLSFMMMVTAIPFSMYDMDSYAAGTYTNDEDVYEYDPNAHTKVSNKQIPDEYTVLDFINFKTDSEEQDTLPLVDSNAPAGHNTEAYISAFPKGRSMCFAGVYDPDNDDKPSLVIKTSDENNGAGVQLYNELEGVQLYEETYNSDKYTDGQVRSGYRYKVHFFRGTETFKSDGNTKIAEDNFNQYTPDAGEGENNEYYDVADPSVNWTFPLADEGFVTECTGWYEFYRFYYAGELTAEWIAVAKSDGDYGFYDIESRDFFSLKDSNLQTSNITQVADKATVTTAPTGVEQAPDGSMHALCATSGEASTFMEYALGENDTTAPTSGWSKEFPEASAGGDYYVWYRAAAGARASDHEKYYNASEPDVITSKLTRQPNPMTAPANQTLTVPFDTVSQTATITGVSNAEGDVTYSLVSGDIANFSIDGTTLTVNPNTPRGTYTFTVKASTTGNSGYDSADVTFEVTVKVTKKFNPLEVVEAQTGGASSGATAKTVDFTPATSAEGNVTYEIKSQKVQGGEAVDYFSIPTASNPTIQVAADSPAGTYVIEISANAAGNDNYEPGSKVITYTLTIADGKSPTAIIFSSTSDIASKQTVTLSGEDNIGITKYYWGNNSNGTPDKDWNTEGENTEEVSASGTYYLITQDEAGNKSEPASITFYKTTFSVQNGSTTAENVLLDAGSEFELPGIEPSEGYKAPETWSNGLAPGTNYEVTADAELTAVCTEITYVLSYNTQGGSDIASSEALFTAEGKVTTAEPTREGYVFKEWNTSADGKGEKVNANTTWKQANSIDVEYETLYAIWYKKITKPVSAEAVVYDGTEQTIGIASADGLVFGGDYKATNAGTYIATFTLEDEYCWEDGTRAAANVSWTINKAANPITAPDNQTWDDVEYSKNAQTFTLNEFNDAKGNVTYSIASGDSEHFSINNRTLTMKAGTFDGTYELLIKGETPGNENYLSGEASFKVTVTVIKANMHITATPYQALPDGAKHTVAIKSDVAGATVEYGNTTDYGYSMVLTKANQDYNLDEVAESEPGTYPVYYKVTLLGYNDVTGDALIKITDDILPITTITSTNDVAERQTVNIKATDNSSVVKYYFGISENAAPNTTEGIVKGKIEKNLTISEPGTYWFVAEDSTGNKGKTSVTFYETILNVEDGNTMAEKVLTAAGNKFKLPTINANTGYEAPDKWSNGMTPGTEFEPTENTRLEAKCWPEGYTSATFGVTENGHSLIVGTDLAVNFLLDMPSNYRGGTMTFTIEHADQPVVVTGTPTNSGMKFTCGINVNQISDGITWEYKVDGNTATSSGKFSFHDYLVKATNEYKEDLPELADFAEKLKVYGYYAQNYLAAEGKYEVASKHNVIPTPSLEPSTIDFSGYMLTKEGTNENIASGAILQSLVLDTTTSIKLYVPLVNGSEWISGILPEITINGTPIAAGKAVIAYAKSGAGKELVIEIPGVNATKYADEYTVVIDGDYTIKTTALAYANKLKEQTSGYAKKLGAALYDLYQAAKGYRDSRSN